MQITNVRYVKSTSGAKLRSTAAGSTVVKTLRAGDLMYDIPGVATVKKALSGTTYIWVKVIAYTIEQNSLGYNSSVSYTGWIAIENTTVVSRTSPSKSSVISTNAKLNQRKQLINARYIYNYLTNKGWRKNAILAMLGNMEAESNINPGHWQNEYKDPSNGYGLVQWTPSTKYTNWLGSTDESKMCDIDKQLNRIIHESEKNLQWIKGKYSPEMKFSEFPTSTKSRDELTIYFFKCYENNGKNEDSARKSNAAKWDMLIGYLTD